MGPFTGITIILALLAIGAAIQYLDDRERVKRHIKRLSVVVWGDDTP